jgi:prepilin signal peptidase PulO-like enzyme (type II secretory pathway)
MEVVFAAIAGLVLGHLVDLAFQRFYTGEQIGGPLYRCASCRFSLRPVFAIPVVGYVVHGGRCPDCSERLPLHSLVLAPGAAAMFVVSALVFDDLAGTVLGGFFGTVFLTLTLTDLERRLLPNRIVYPSILIAIAVSWAWPDSSVVDVLAGGLVAIGIAVGLLMLSLPFGAGAFGMGDVKMIVLIGFVVGLPAVAVGVVLGTLAAAVVTLGLIAFRLVGRRDYVPHGPFLAFGALLAMWWGEEIWDAYRGN